MNRYEEDQICNELLVQREKQIEKINDIISEEYNSGNDNWYDIADKVYNKLFSEDSVVLIREEYERGIIQIGYIEELEKDKKTYQEMNLKLLNKIEELELKLKQAIKEVK